MSTKFALAIGVALSVHLVGSACLRAAPDDASPLPPGALARLGSLRWRHGDVISYVAFLPDGKAVLTAGLDNTVRLWDRESGKELRRFAIPQAAAPQAVQPGGGVRVVFSGAMWGQNGIALSQDGKTLATVIPNNVIQLWDINSGKELRQLKTPPTGVVALLFSPDGKTLAARAGDRQIYLLETTEMGKDMRPLRAAQPAGPNRFFAGNAAGMAFAPDSKSIATAESTFNNGMVTTHLKLISVDSGAAIREIETKPQGVSSIIFSPNGKYIAYGGSNIVTLCDAGTGKEIRILQAPAGAVALVFSPDGKTVAAKGRDQLIRLFDTESAKEVGQLGEANGAPGANQFVFFGGAADMRDTAFTPDGKVLAAGGGHALRFWEVASAKELPMAGGHRGPVTGVVLSSDGKILISRGADNIIRRWDARSGKELGQFPIPPGTTSATFSSDARMIALGILDATVRVHETASGKEIHQFKGHVNGTGALVFSPDGKMLASRGSYDQMIRMFDTGKGAELRQISLQANNPVGAGGFMLGGYAGPSGLALAFSPDGQTLAAHVSAMNPQGLRGGIPAAPAGVGNMLRLWDVTTGKEIRQILVPQSISAVSIAFSPDGRVLALENVNQVIHLLEIASGKERGQLGQPAIAAAAGNVGGWAIVGGGFGGFGVANRPATSNTLAFAPDGETLAAKGPDHSVRVWDLAALKEIDHFKGHGAGIASIDFAQDGKTLASGSNDTTILVWDLTRMKREPKPQLIELNPKEVESLWTDLYGDDAAKAYRSILKLSTAPQAAPFLQQQLKPAAPGDAKKIDRWIVDLDSSNYKIRTTAAAELEKLGELVVPALKKVLAAPSSVEIRRRVEQLLEKLTDGTLTPEQVRLARAMEVLEKLGTAEARQILETMSKGAPGAFATRQAQDSLDRLARRSVASRP